MHYALKLNIYAVINKATIKKNMRKVPRKYRKAASKMSEFHVSKIYIPESIIISPMFDSTSIYGINFSPLGANISGLIKNKKINFKIGVNLNITYLWIHSKSIFKDNNYNMHFFRPGIGINPKFVVKITKKALFTFGGKYNVYIPQKVTNKNSFTQFGTSNTSLWNYKSLYFTFNYQVPFRYR